MYKSLIWINYSRDYILFLRINLKIILRGEKKEYMEIQVYCWDQVLKEAAKIVEKGLEEEYFLVTSPGIGAGLGPQVCFLWQEKLETFFKGKSLRLLIDFGDQGGWALAGIQAGIKHVRFTGHPIAFKRLSHIANSYGATLYPCKRK